MARVQEGSREGLFEGRLAGVWGCISHVHRSLSQARPNSMQPLIGPLLAAMHRVAKDHNQQPAAGILGSKAFPPS